MCNVKRQMGQFKLRLQPIVQFMTGESAAFQVDLEGARSNLLL